MSTSTSRETDVLVVGAGPAGLTLACELRRRGVACRLIDEYAEFPRTSRALGLQARTLEVFDDMGVVEPIIAQGATIFGITFLQGERVVSTVKLRLDRRTRPDQPYRGVVILNQAKVEGILRDWLGALGGTVERSRELVALHEEADAVVATVNEPATGAWEEVRAAYLLGCDGAHSFVRKALGLTFAGSTYPEHFLLADAEVDGDDLPRDTAVAWLNEEGMLAAFPLPESRLYRLFAVVYPDEKGEVPAASLEVFRRLFAERAGGAGVRLSNPIWLSNFRVNRRMVDRYRKGRGFVAGDAAHIHSPSGGRA
ncbi:MAG: FAD-dependent monooxygenase [Actinomycetota bacterium]|nr:FAD-dependent monooxygenase [Actinomycetota bacterium]